MNIDDYALLKDLQARRITYQEYLKRTKKHSVNKPSDAVEIIREIIPKSTPRNKLTIQMIKTMSFVETVNYFAKKVTGGIRKDDLKCELFRMYLDGLINGFDYRYIIEAMGEEIPLEFLIEAYKSGRYNK